MTLTAQPNWIGIVVATVVVMMLGWLWFTLLFGRAYATVMGRAFDPSAKPSPLFIVGPLLCTLVTTITSAYMMRALNITTLSGALGFGAVVGIGYLGATAVNMAINPNIPRPLAYGFLSAAYFLVASVLISVVLQLIG